TCPDTQFILDHCGNAPVHNPDGSAPNRTKWKADLEALARRKNLVCKVSGLVNTARKGSWGPDDLAAIINHTLDTFGPDRVMFGRRRAVGIHGREHLPRPPAGSLIGPAAEVAWLAALPAPGGGIGSLAGAAASVLALRPLTADPPLVVRSGDRYQFVADFAD